MKAAITCLCCADEVRSTRDCGECMRACCEIAAENMDIFDVMITKIIRFTYIRGSTLRGRVSRFLHYGSTEAMERRVTAQVGLYKRYWDHT